MYIGPDVYSHSSWLKISVMTLCCIDEPSNCFTNDIEFLANYSCIAFFFNPIFYNVLHYSYVTGNQYRFL